MGMRNRLKNPVGAKIVARSLVGAGCKPALSRIVGKRAGLKPAPTNAFSNQGEKRKQPALGQVTDLGCHRDVIP
jgi:hypothetical protein